MTLQPGYIIIFLIILSAKISYCQQDFISILYNRSCPENIMESDSTFSREEILNGLFSEGFPYAVVDSHYMAESDRIRFQVDCGPQINFVNIQWKGKDLKDLSSDQKLRKIIPWKEVVLQRQKILKEMANEGFPYARLLTNPVAINQDTLLLEYLVDTIRRIYIQELQFKGDFSMNHTLFESMTGIGEFQSFSLDRIEQSRQVIRQWDFADLKQVEFDFNPYGVNLIYHIEPSRPSRFDLLIGLVPSNRVDKKYEITGNAFIDIRNQLKMAERIYIKFDKYANSSQSFDLRFDFPYLPVLKSGILAEGLIDRRDSSVLDVHGRLGLQYRWKTNLKYAFYLQRDQSRLITVNSRQLMQSGILPDELDYNYSAAGLSLSYHSLDDFLNPRKGTVLNGTINGGIKKLVRNGQIIAIDLPSDQSSFQLQYDSLNQSTLKAEMDISWDQYLPVGLYSTIRLGTKAGWTWASASLYQNEQRRLGGFQDYRGFPEKSFLADAYTAWTVEYRFLFGAESNAYGFTDFGLMHQPDQLLTWNFPYSVGIGLNLGTKAGVFGISYAIGGQREQPLSLDQSRVNFGLVVNY